MAFPDLWSKYNVVEPPAFKPSPRELARSYSVSRVTAYGSYDQVVRVSFMRLQSLHPNRATTFQRQNSRFSSSTDGPLKVKRLLLQPTMSFGLNVEVSLQFSINFATSLSHTSTAVAPLKTSWQHICLRTFLQVYYPFKA